jgi:hypothetical protein
MQHRRAMQIGALHRQLGIDANSRVTSQISPTGGVVSDLSTGIRYTVNFNPPNIETALFAVPQWAQTIFNANDDELKKRWTETETEGWNDERETIFAELTLRGIRIGNL